MLLATFHPALFQRLLGERARGRHTANGVKLLAHRPEVGRQPVQQDTDREGDAREYEHQRHQIHHDLLLLGERVVQRARRHVLHHQLTHTGELRSRHEHDHHHTDDLHVDGRRCCDRNVVHDGDRVLEGGRQGRTEDRGRVRLTGHVRRQWADRRLRPGSNASEVAEHPEEREEDRGLQQERQARRERVGTRALVQTHRLLGHRLPGLRIGLALVLLLDLLHLGLDELHPSGSVNLLDEQRDQDDPDDDGQANDRQSPGEP